MKVPARLPTSSPDTPKSQILNWPSLVTRMLDGLMSGSNQTQARLVSVDAGRRLSSEWIENAPRWMIRLSCK